MQPDPNNSDIIYTSIAFLGGIARELQNFLEKKQITWRSIFARAFVAMFSGVMFAHTCQYFWGISDLTVIAGGLGGWMGPGAMEFLTYLFRKHFKYDKE